MKFCYFVFFILITSSTHSFAQGSHGGNGGDLRRYRASLAQSTLMNALQELNSISSDCQLSSSHLNSVLFKNKQVLNQWASRSRIRWIDEDQRQCLSMQFRPADILLSFSYVNCPVPTPQGYYLSAIASPFFRKFFPDQDPMKVLNDLQAILQEARHNRCIPTPPQPSQEVQSYDPSSFAKVSSANAILESGRKLALKILDALEQPVSGGPFLNRAFSSPIDSFLRRSKTALESEVRLSPFTITADRQAESCGNTELRSQAPIYFSTRNCTDIQSNLDAAWLILHESTHHLKVDAENFADAVAIELIKTSAASSTPL
jgi:hypothetical protein